MTHLAMAIPIHRNLWRQLPFVSPYL